MSRRTKPVGRDRLAILGAPVGAVAALSATHVNHRIGTNDYMYEVIVRINRTTNTATLCPCMWAYEDTGDHTLSVAEGYVRAQVGAVGYNSAVSPLVQLGTWLHIIVFLDRSSNAYYYANGEYISATDISAQVGVDINSDTLGISGRYGAAYMMSDSQLDRLFVIDPANFPTEAERNAIVAERWANPDAESPTLAARTNYATERRVDVDFSDTEYNDTTVVNNGTGAATFTIGGGLAWSAVRSVAERATPMKPAENWYYFDPTHEATATDDLGGVAGSAICEIIYADIDKLMPATDYLARIFQGAGDYFALIATAGTTIYAQQAHGGTTINTYLKNAGYRSVSLDGVHVLHMYVSTADGVQRIMVDGQSHFWGATVGSLDMSGNVTPKFGDSSMHDGILAMRLWNTAGAMTNVVASLQARVPNPWEVPTTLAGATLIGNWEMKMDAVQPASSTVLVNRANPGTCDLTISAGTFSSTTRLAVRGQS